MDSLPPDYIRLLYIEASCEESPIRCRLVNTSLQASPPYEALSYTWGSVEQDSIVTCDGFPMLVTHNLYDALRYLRQPDGDRIMWIDAVCINQRNDKERAEQVAIMKDIYARAFHVVIWLGKEMPEDKLVFSLLNRIKEVFAKYGGPVELGPIQNTVYNLGLPEASEPDWTALVKFFQRPWFQRIWVVQEATVCTLVVPSNPSLDLHVSRELEVSKVLGSTILTLDTQMARESTVSFGPLSFKWYFICEVANSVRKSGYLGLYPIDLHAPGTFSAIVIHYLRLAHEAQMKTWTLLELLRLTRNYMATDPRDKVFALIGVVTDLNSIGLEVDYRLSTEEVYLLVAIHNLEKRKDLEVLANGGVNSGPENLKLPSWVPDWSHNNDRRTILAAGAANTGFRAAGDTRPILSISPDKKTLKVRGAVIDTVSQITTALIRGENSNTDPLSEAEQHDTRLQNKASIESCIVLAEAAYNFPEGHTREESLWRTLCCDHTVDTPIRRAPTEYAIGYQLLRKLHEATTDDGQYDYTRTDSEFIRDNWVRSTALHNSISKYSVGRNFCVTTGGHLGRVPRGSLIGDKICLLFGAVVPFVLRESSDGYFKLIGECYIHGIMDGEVMKKPDMETLGQDFEIL